MSPVITRARTVTGAGVLAMLLLILGFGNQPYVDWVASNAQGRNAWDLLLRTLAWPRWFIFPGGTPSGDVIGHNLRALFLIAFVAAVLGTVRAVGSAGAFALGWFSVIVSAAAAALLTSFVMADASTFNALSSAANASVYGLFVGWLVGLAAALSLGADAVAA